MAQTLLIVNGVDITPYILADSYQLGRYKWWGSDAGRGSITGKYNGTLIGIFPKISFTLGTLNNNTASQLYSIFDNAYVTVSYYDTKNKTMKTGVQFYCGDVIDKIKSAITMKHDQTQIEIVAVERYS